LDDVGPNKSVQSFAKVFSGLSAQPLPRSASATKESCVSSFPALCRSLHAGGTVVNKRRRLEHSGSSLPELGFGHQRCSRGMFPDAVLASADCRLVAGLDPDFQADSNSSALPASGSDSFLPVEASTRGLRGSSTSKLVRSCLDPSLVPPCRCNSVRDVHGRLFRSSRRRESPQASVAKPFCKRGAACPRVRASARWPRASRGLR